MTETTPRSPAAPEAPTEQLHRPDPARDRNPPTEVLSIHDLLDGPVAYPEEKPVLVDRPVTPPVPPPPATTTREPEKQPSETWQRMRADASAAWIGARDQTAHWLRQGDNALIVATAAVALLLLLVIAAVV